VRHVRTELDVSERRACTVVEQPRSSQRYAPRRAERDREVTRRMLELARHQPRYGYRRITALLRREGWVVNRKRVHRLWRQEGLKVPVRQRKKRRVGSSDNSCVRRRAERPNQVWSYDFVMDQTEDGRRLKWLPIVDEYTRECLRLEVERSIEAVDVVEVLEQLIAERGAPEFIRSDNGPEFVAEVVRKHLVQRGGETAFIAPGAPWENAYSETFNSRLGDELLKREVFTSLLEAKVLGARYRTEYNEERPHSALGYQTPAAFAAACGAACSASLRTPPHTIEHKEQTPITTGT
jgi:putative transposase